MALTFDMFGRLVEYAPGATTVPPWIAQGQPYMPPAPVPALPAAPAQPAAPKPTQSKLTPQMSAILATIRQLESGGNYNVPHPIGRPDQSASGAYGFTDATWGGFGGYAHAYQAPKEVQDAKAAAWAQHILDLHKNDANPLEWLPASWFAGVSGAMTKNWNQNPNPGAGNHNTIQGYVDKWTGLYATISKQGFSPAPPPPEPAPPYTPDQHEEAVTLAKVYQPMGSLVNVGGRSVFSLTPGVSQ